MTVHYEAVGLPRERTLRAAFAACVLILLSATVLQKIAVPGFNGLLAFTFVTVLAVTLLLVLSEKLLVNLPALFAFGIFVALSAFSVVFSTSSTVSATSWLLLCCVQAPFVFRFAPGALDFDKLLSFVSALGAVFAVCGVLQLLVQAVAGSNVAFWLDTHIPRVVEMVGYNKLNTMSWDVEGVYKSNGIFFAEPSYFSQFLALSVLSEFLGKCRPLRMLLLGAGLLSSYSGTGLMTLGMFSLFYLPPARRWQIAIGGAIALLVLIFAGDALQLGTITSRIDEFVEPGTSGHARFVSIFNVLWEISFADTGTFLIGRGPGTVTEFFYQNPFEVFAPTYAKVFYEYGAIGFAAYMTFFYIAMLQRRAALALPLSFTYFFLGGYLLDAAVIAQMLVLAAWSDARRENA